MKSWPCSWLLRPSLGPRRLDPRDTEHAVVLRGNVEMGGWHQDWVLLALNVWCPCHVYNTPRTKSYSSKMPATSTKHPADGPWGCSAFHSQTFSPPPPAPVHRGLLHAQAGDRGLPEEVQRQEKTQGNRSSPSMSPVVGVAWPGSPQRPGDPLTSSVLH